MNNNPRLIKQRPLSVDGVKPKQPPPPTAKPAGRQRTAAPEEQSGIWQKLQLPLLLLVGAVGGFFVENLALGLGMLTVYAIAAFVKRIPSRTTFTLALLLLGAISALLFFKPSPQLINNFATYAFVLLLVGVITLGREARHPEFARPKYKR
jgi:hypothetical protein